jgi:hypothetical protein
MTGSTDANTGTQWHADGAQASHSGAVIMNPPRIKQDNSRDRDRDRDRTRRAPIRTGPRLLHQWDRDNDKDRDTMRRAPRPIEKEHYAELPFAIPSKEKRHLGSQVRSWTLLNGYNARLPDSGATHRRQDCKSCRCTAPSIGPSSLKARLQV